MLRLLETKEAGLGAKLQAFFRSGEAIGISKELTATAIRVVGPVNDDIWPLAMIDPKNGSVWFDSMVRHAKSYGRTEEAMQLYARLVALLDDPRLRQEKMAPGTKSGVRSLPLSELLKKPDQLISAFADYLHVVGTGRMVDQGPQTLTDR